MAGKPLGNVAMTATERQRKWRDKVRRRADQPATSEAEAPYEMVNLVPRMTGLPMTVWASPRGQARHGIRIKVSPTHGRKMIVGDAVTVALPRGVPRVIARTGVLAPADRVAIFQWCAINEAALVDYWAFRIDTDDFLQRLRPISPPIPP